MQIALSQIRAANFTVACRWLWNWWRKELLNLLPEKAAEWLSGYGRARLFLTPTDRGAIVELRSSREALISSDLIGRYEMTPDKIDQFLRTHGVEPNDADVGLLLPGERIFSRQLRIPLEAIGAIDTIVSQDLEKKTPFKPRDVYSGYATLPDNSSKKILVHQWVVQRQYVDEALAELKIDLDEIVFVASRAAGPNEPAPFIKVGSRSDTANFWFRRISLGLCCSAALLVFVAVGVKYWTQQQEMDRLNAEIVIKNKKAQRVRSLIDQLRSRKSALLHLRLQRREMPGVLDLWEEVTRILPTHTWLTELRVSETGSKREEQITLSGFSRAAPSLVGTIDNSPSFLDAALTSPIAIDPGEGREHFSIQARIRAAPELKEASR